MKKVRYALPQKDFCTCYVEVLLAPLTTRLENYRSRAHIKQLENGDTTSVLVFQVFKKTFLERRSCQNANFISFLKKLIPSKVYYPFSGFKMKVDHN